MSRRERLRIETTAEIKSVALGLMASGGPGAITLRAIARDMGMTPNAIYGYFATRDDLITALIGDVYTSLAATVDAALEPVPAEAVAARIAAWGHAFRGWALANPEGFRLIYVDAVPGYVPPDGAPAAEIRFCTILAVLAEAAWPYAAPLYADAGFEWSDFDMAVADEVRRALPDLSPGAMALSLYIWARVHGMVTLELQGRLQSGTGAGKLFRAELGHLIRSLGVPGDVI